MASDIYICVYFSNEKFRDLFFQRDLSEAVQGNSLKVIWKELFIAPGILLRVWQYFSVFGRYFLIPKNFCGIYSDFAESGRKFLRRALIFLSFGIRLASKAGRINLRPAEIFQYLTGFF